MQGTEFQAAYRDARRQVVEKAVAALQAACEKAVAALVRNLNRKAPQVKVSAARAILERSFEATPATPGGGSATGGGQLQTIGPLVTPTGKPINVSPTADIDVYIDANLVITVIGVSGGRFSQ